jgi:hypothetical protein
LKSHGCYPPELEDELKPLELPPMLPEEEEVDLLLEPVLELDEDEDLFVVKLPVPLLVVGVLVIGLFVNEPLL